jgi:hypothetical protein
MLSFWITILNLSLFQIVSFQLFIFIFQDQPQNKFQYLLHQFILHSSLIKFEYNSIQVTCHVIQYFHWSENLILTKSIHIFHQLITSNKQQYETQVQFYASKTIYTLEKYITIYAQQHRPE